MSKDRQVLINLVFESIRSVKTIDGHLMLEQKLVKDCGIESIDVVDLFYEIHKRTGIDINMIDFAKKIRETNHRSFNDMKIDDLVNYLLTVST